MPISAEKATRVLLAGSLGPYQYPRPMPEPQPPLLPSIARRARRLAAWFAAPLALATAASYLDGWWWGLALIVHFRPHLAAASLVCLAAALFGRERRLAALCLALLALNAAPLLPYLGLASRAEAVPSANLRLLTYNMHGAATDRGAFRELIEREHPDLVVLTELPGNLPRLVERTPALPPYRAGAPSRDGLATLLFSRWPLESGRIERTPDGEGSVLTAELCASERWQGCLTIVALHASHPFGAGATTQAQQLAIAARLAAASPEHRALVAGDLNLTPWSPAFAELLARGGLVDTGPRRGLSATWLSRLPFVGLLIDHVLVSLGIEARANRLGADAGSDHFPVIADLAIPAAGQ